MGTMKKRTRSGKPVAKRGIKDLAVPDAKRIKGGADKKHVTTIKWGDVRL